jgi:hypothetical protein
MIAETQFVNQRNSRLCLETPGNGHLPSQMVHANSRAFRHWPPPTSTERACQ